LRPRNADVTTGRHDGMGDFTQVEVDVSSNTKRDTGAAPTLRREVCDKCGARMDLAGSAHGFERWTCPGCQQVIGIDRDPEVGGRFQISRGQPWNYAPEAFQR
jgi:tRNA(Ile2) C34 agmatinyltransferase TiaS